MKINKEILEKFNPCEYRWDNYLEHYREFDGSFCEFLELENISIGDKIWVFTQKWGCEKFQKLQREFALICADRATIDCDTPEVQELFYMSAIINVSEDFGLRDSDEYRAAYRSADRAAYWSADRAADQAADQAAYWSAHWSAHWAAYWSADQAAERKVQLDIIRSLF